MERREDLRKIIDGGEEENNQFLTDDGLIEESIDEKMDDCGNDSDMREEAVAL
jgi:hypothetical protein